MAVKFGVCSKRRFILQQGVSLQCSAPAPEVFSALQFQPRVMAVLVTAGAVLHSAELFAALGLVLWWNVVAPRWNPFDALYYAMFGSRRGILKMRAAPPRLFAQALAGLLSWSAAGMLILNRPVEALVFESALMAAIAAILATRFCFGAFLFHWLSSRPSLQYRTSR